MEKVGWLVAELRNSYVQLASNPLVSKADILGAYYRLESQTSFNIGRCGYKLVVKKIDD